MSRTVYPVVKSTCLIAMGVCLAGQAAFASSFGLREESAEGLGNSFAGQTAKAYDSSTVYYNPAGMALLTANEISDTVTWISPDVRFSGSNSNPLYASGIGGPTTAGIQGPNVIKPAAIGSIFAVYQLDPDWHVGFSFAVPYGQRSEYKENWVGRYEALASDLTDYEASLVASYKINDQFAIGGGPRVDYLNGRLSQAINISTVGLLIGSVTNNAGLKNLALGWAETGTDGLAKLTGDSYGVGYTLSGLYTPDSDTRIGLAYKSKSFHNLTGTSQLTLPASASAAGPVFNSLFTTGSASLKVTLPDTATVGIYHALNDRWAVMSDIQWTEWSTIKSLNVLNSSKALISMTPENWKNTFFFSFGVNYKPADRWTLHFGTAYDQAPMNDSNRLARIPDSNRYWASFGVSYGISPSSDVHFGYGHLFTPGGSITDATAQAMGGGVLTGSYQASVDIVSATYAMRF